MPLRRHLEKACRETPKSRAASALDNPHKERSRSSGDIEMGLDQMFGLRPLPGMAGYRSHLKGLYLTGASTHPGGGIMGASGRNAARVLLRDLSRRRFRPGAE